jgi:predicted nucleotidyltransferase
MIEEIIMKDDFIKIIKNYLIEKYDCHLIILYGSYARNEFDNESDVDIICFSDKINPENDISIISGRQLDVWIYNSKEMSKTDQYLRIIDGQIIFDKNNHGIKFLNSINQFYKNGPEKLTDQKKIFLKSWLTKMLSRSKKGDCEGNYRLHWLLIDCLEIYFNLNDLWYLGPKKSLKWLEQNDEETYELFNNALAIKCDITDVEKLISHLNKI